MYNSMTQYFCRTYLEDAKKYIFLNIFLGYVTGLKIPLEISNLFIIEGEIVFILMVLYQKQYSTVFVRITNRMGYALLSFFRSRILADLHYTSSNIFGVFLQALYNKKGFKQYNLTNPGSNSLLREVFFLRLLRHKHLTFLKNQTIFK